MLFVVKAQHRAHSRADVTLLIVQGNVGLRGGVVRDTADPGLPPAVDVELADLVRQLSSGIAVKGSLEIRKAQDTGRYV